MHESFLELKNSIKNVCKTGKVFPIKKCIKMSLLTYKSWGVIIPVSLGVSEGCEKDKKNNIKDKEEIL